jgi:hypothetical protein
VVRRVDDKGTRNFSKGREVNYVERGWKWKESDRQKWLWKLVRNLLWEKKRQLMAEVV